MTNPLRTLESLDFKSKDYFFENFEDSRRDFLRISKNVLKKYPQSDLGKIKFSKKEEPIDFLLLKGKKSARKRIVLVTSGIHGVEGFTGSAIQRYLLKSNRLSDFLKETDFLFLHGINPYGFQKKKRVNEHNIDLNRNFYFRKEKIPKREKNLGYRRFASFFMPRFPFTFWYLEYFLFFLRFTGIMLRIGIREFSNAFVNGQFEYKKGIYFGGKRPEPVVKQLRRFFKNTLKEYKSILHLDIHTGHGEENGLVLIQNADLGTSEDQNISLLSEGLPLLKPDSGGAFYKTAGDFTDFLGKIFPNEKKIYPLTVEIGTTGNTNFWQSIRTSFIIVAENRIRHHGSWYIQNTKKIEELFFRYFYPDSESWRNTIFVKTVETMQILVKRFCEK